MILPIYFSRARCKNASFFWVSFSLASFAKSRLSRPSLEERQRHWLPSTLSNRQLILFLLSGCRRALRSFHIRGTSATTRQQAEQSLRTVTQLPVRTRFC